MATKFICRNCSAVTGSPKMGTCKFLGDVYHDWIPFTDSGDMIRKDYYDVGFNKKWGAIAVVVVILPLLFLLAGKNMENSLAILIGFGFGAYFIGGFLKQILQIILAIGLFFGICYLLEYFKIVDFSTKPTQSPPKVKRVSN